VGQEKIYHCSEEKSAWWGTEAKGEIVEKGKGVTLALKREKEGFSLAKGVNLAKRKKSS